MLGNWKIKLWKSDQTACSKSNLKLNLKYFLCKFNWNFNSLTVNAYRGYKIVAFGTFWHKILLVVTVTVQTPVPALKLLIINSYRVLGVFLRVLKFFIFLSFWPAIGCTEINLVLRKFWWSNTTPEPPLPLYTSLFSYTCIYRILCKDRNVDEALTASDAGEVVLVVERVLSLQ